MKYPVKFCEMYKMKREKNSITNRYVIAEMYVTNVFERVCVCVYKVEALATLMR